MNDAVNGRGILVMCLTMLIFASQDGLSRHLAGEYNVFMVVMIRYWFLLAFVVALARMRQGSVRAVARSRAPLFQLARGVLLAVEILVAVAGFTLLGLAEAHAIFAAYPLIITALSGPMLGEKVGWRRWAAVAAGAVGMLIIVQPGAAAFSPLSLLPVLAALLFALYNVATRYAARIDSSATSFFWTGLGGCIAMTAIGPFFWEPMAPEDWWVMAVLCVTGASGHFLLIKAYELAEASAVQPFAFLQLVFASIIGVIFFGETIPSSTLVGAAVIVGAGVFTLLRERRVKAG